MHHRFLSAGDSGAGTDRFNRRKAAFVPKVAHIAQHQVRNGLALAGDAESGADATMPPAPVSRRKLLSTA